MCVCACGLQFYKNRWEVEHPSNALLTLLSLFLCSPSQSVSVLLSLSVPPRWHKEEKTVSTGRCPLMDVSPSILPPEGLQIRTANSPLLCNPHSHFISVSSFYSSIFLFYQALDSCSVVSYKVQPLAPLFGLLCTQLGRLGFLFNKCLFVLIEESS